MLRLDENFYKYQALAALAAAANYNNFVSNGIMKRNEDGDTRLNEPKNKRFKLEEQYSDIESEEENQNYNNRDEEIDVGNETYSDDENKIDSNKPKSSFFISDILGLESAPKPVETKKIQTNLVEQLIQNYQQQLQKTFDIYRLINSTNTPNQSEKLPNNNNNNSNKQENKSDEVVGTSGGSSASILSSLEKLAKSQLNEAATPVAIITSPKPKKIEVQKKVENAKKLEEPEPQATTDKKIDTTNPTLFPAWVYCTRYSDRPSAGPRHRKKKVKNQLTNIKVKKEKVLTKTNQSSSCSSNSSFSLASPSQQNSFLNSMSSKLKENEIYDMDSDNNDNDDDNGNYEDDETLNNDFNEDDNSDNESNASHSKRPRTAFTSSQLQRLKHEFEKCKYLTGEKRQYLANELNLNESQIKIWFQNKRAKIKKTSGVKNSLALQLMAQGLYNHSNPKSNQQQSNDSN